MKKTEKNSGQPPRKKPQSNVPQPDRRQPPPAQSNRTVKHKRRRKNYTVYYIMFLVIVVAVALVLANTVLFSVSEITVTGETSYTAEQIIEASELTTGQNLLHISTSDAEQKIMNKLILVDNVKVTKDFPNKLKIELIPAERFANIEYDDGKYCVISYGDKILAENAASPDIKIPIVRGYEPETVTQGGIVNSTDEAKTKLIHEIYDDLRAAELWERTTAIDITDRFSIQIVCEDRITLEIGTSAEMSGKLFIAKELITTEIGQSEKVRVLLQDTEKVYVQDNYAHQTLPPPVSTEEVTEESTDESGTSEQE